MVLLGYLDTLYLQNLSGIEVDVTEVRGSVWVDKCTECTFTGRMHQLRIHETHETTFIVHVTSKPIIERCTALSFGCFPFEVFYVLITAKGVNFWNDV
jgi:hypothetical protein